MAFRLFWSKPRPFPPLPCALSLFPCIHLAWGLQRPRRVGFSVPGELKGEPGVPGFEALTRAVEGKSEA